LPAETDPRGSASAAPVASIARGFASLERRPGAVFAALGALSIAAYLVALTVFPRPHNRVLDGDAIQYYAYLRSIVFDGDLDFRNEYAALYRDRADAGDNVWLTGRTPTGRPPNMMSIGPALLWSPFFLLTCLGVWLARLAGLDVPFDGFAAPFQLSAGVGGIVYAAGGAYLAYRLAARLYPRVPAFWGALVAWLATPAIYYSLVSPAYSHAVSLFAVALFSYVWFVTRGDERIRRAALLGALGGLAMLVRWQDVIVLVLPVLETTRRVARRQLEIRPAIVRTTLMAAAAGLVVIPQLVAWQRIYGTPIVMPQGTGFMRWTDPALWQVLFSTRHGLLLWTPAVVPALLGLTVVRRRDTDLGWGAVLVVLLSIYINACVGDWWAGEAFGARRFAGDTVFFALGLAAVFAGTPGLRRPGAVRAAALVLITYNVLFLFQYQLFMRGLRELVPYPTTVKQILIDRLTLPWRLARAWWSSP
jgi:hypothetical protein